MFNTDAKNTNMQSSMEKHPQKNIQPVKAKILIAIGETGLREN